MVAKRNAYLYIEHTGLHYITTKSAKNNPRITNMPQKETLQLKLLHMSTERLCIASKSYPCNRSQRDVGTSHMSNNLQMFVTTQCLVERTSMVTRKRNAPQAYKVVRCSGSHIV
jgi:hypothetical protein